MSEDIKEIYLSNLEWTKTHDNMGGVMGNVVFKDNISYEEYEKLINNVYCILTKKDEIETLTKRNKEIYEGFMATTEELCETTKEVERLNNILNRFEETLEIRIKLGDENIDMLLAYKRVLELVKELRGDSK